MNCWFIKKIGKNDVLQIWIDFMCVLQKCWNCSIADKVIKHLKTPKIEHFELLKRDESEEKLE